MRVKIGNQWHDSHEEPICIQVSLGEQQQIGSMDRSVAPHGRYAVFPDSWSANPAAMREWVMGDGEEAITQQEQEHEATKALASTRSAYSLAQEVLGLRAQAAELKTKNGQLAFELMDKEQELIGRDEMLENEREIATEQCDMLTAIALRAGVITRRSQVPLAKHVQEILDWIEGAKAKQARLAEELEHTQGQRDTAIQRAQVAEDVQDAMVAQVDRMTDAACSEGAGPKLRAAIDAAPTASLARRDSVKQAEALESAVRTAEAKRQKAVAQWLQHMADNCRHQAEEVGE